MDNRAQISFELIVILAAVFAVAVLVVTTMLSNAKSFNAKLESKMDSIFKEIDNISID